MEALQDEIRDINKRINIIQSYPHSYVSQLSSVNQDSIKKLYQCIEILNQQIIQLQSKK